MSVTLWVKVAGDDIAGAASILAVAAYEIAQNPALVDCTGVARRIAHEGLDIGSVCSR